MEGSNPETVEVQPMHGKTEVDPAALDEIKKQFTSRGQDAMNQVRNHLDMFVKMMVGPDNCQEIVMKIMEMEPEKLQEYTTNWDSLVKRANELDESMQSHPEELLDENENN